MDVGAEVTITFSQPMVPLAQTSKPPPVSIPAAANPIVAWAPARTFFAPGPPAPSTMTTGYAALKRSWEASTACIAMAL